ncbi:histidine phosphatase family protein [Paenibacillus sp. FSL H8-0537]|uniref:histidine phosphatase family protein n=1 Tax=Paenibacillus sp. FSL H8-0537 TaxID=2921399 RepID=UPI0031016E76
MTRIGWIRHGVTQWNIEGRAQGSTDIPLNEEGKRQAAVLAERLSKEEWHHIYSSDLQRALVTAETVAARLGGGMAVKQDERLREMGGGLLEGMTEAERILKWGADWRKVDWQGESHESVIGRGFEVLREISHNHPGQNILIVSHGALIGRCLKELVPDAYKNEPLQNTSISTIYANAAGGWSCEKFNCALHLSGVADEVEAK